MKGAVETRARAERHQALLGDCEPEGMVSRPHICVFSDALSVSARDVLALSARLGKYDGLLEAAEAACRGTAGDGTIRKLREAIAVLVEEQP